MFRVGIIGPESTGKSSLARYLAKRYNSIYVPEYGREFVERKGTTEITFEELCKIAEHQINLMQRLEDNNKNLENVVLYDTELIMTKVWFEYAFGYIPKWLNDAILHYPMDVYLLTYPDIAWYQDGTRSNGSNEKRQELFARYETEIQALNIPYYIIRHC